MRSQIQVRPWLEPRLTHVLLLQYICINTALGNASCMVGKYNGMFYLIEIIQNIDFFQIKITIIGYICNSNLKMFKHVDAIKSLLNGIFAGAKRSCWHTSSFNIQSRFKSPSPPITKSIVHASNKYFFPFRILHMHITTKCISVNNNDVVTTTWLFLYFFLMRCENELIVLRCCYRILNKNCATLLFHWLVDYHTSVEVIS